MDYVQEGVEGRVRKKDGNVFVRLWRNWDGERGKSEKKREGRKEKGRKEQEQKMYTNILAIFEICPKSQL